MSRMVKCDSCDQIAGLGEAGSNREGLPPADWQTIRDAAGRTRDICSVCLAKVFGGEADGREEEAKP